MAHKIFLSDEIEQFIELTHYRLGNVPENMPHCGHLKATGICSQTWKTGLVFRHLGQPAAGQVSNY